MEFVFPKTPVFGVFRGKNGGTGTKIEEYDMRTKKTGKGELLET